MKYRTKLLLEGIYLYSAFIGKWIGISLIVLTTLGIYLLFIILAWDTVGWWLGVVVLLIEFFITIALIEELS